MLVSRRSLRRGGKWPLLPVIDSGTDPSDQLLDPRTHIRERFTTAGTPIGFGLQDGRCLMISQQR